MSARFHAEDRAKTRAKLPESFEDALSELVYESGIPAKAIASAVGIRTGYLTDAANAGNDSAHLQARLIAPLTNVTGNDVLIRRICHDCGGVFVPLNRSAAFNERTAEVLKETAEYLHSVAIAEADGKVTERE